jgi:hypothetical protein
MGRIHAMELADMSLRDELALGEAIKTHLTCNHYPPVARPWHAIALSIVKRARAGTLDWNEKISNPLNGKLMTVNQIVEGLHLEDFCATEQDDG